jgi:hypothetical protein
VSLVDESHISRARALVPWGRNRRPARIFGDGNDDEIAISELFEDCLPT